MKLILLLLIVTIMFSSLALSLPTPARAVGVDLKPITPGEEFDIKSCVEACENKADPQKCIEKCSQSELEASFTSIYQFGLAMGGFLAFAAVVYGGIKYTVSAGNPAAQGDAKSWIKSAIIGLLLLGSAALILQIINPDVFTAAKQTDLEVFN